MEQTTQSRNYGIDLLRIVAMFMIVLLHLLGRGGLLSSLNHSSGKFYIAWFIEAGAFCAVNCYALISGYVGISGTQRCSKIILLWIQIIFYTLLITLCFVIFRPDTVNESVWLRTVFPISTSHYWYLTAYFGLFFFMPFLNKGIRHVGKKEAVRFLTVVLVFFTAVPSIFQIDPFLLSDGYSLLWLGCLYTAGGLIRQHQLFSSVKKSMALLIYVLCILVTWACKILGTHRGLDKVKNMFLQYTSPTMFIASIALFLFFSGLEIRQNPVKKLITLLAPATLGVYIIHTHNLFWNHGLKGATRSFAADPALLMLVKIFLIAGAIYLICSLAEVLRIRLFHLLHIDRLIKRIDKEQKGDSQ